MDGGVLIASARALPGEMASFSCWSNPGIQEGSWKDLKTVRWFNSGIADHALARPFTVGSRTCLGIGLLFDSWVQYLVVL